MAKTKDGTLFLGKKERESLRIIKEHIKKDCSYGAGGTFYKKDDYEADDLVSIRKAMNGIEVIDFILDITK
jgi:hypothetical protein